MTVETAAVMAGEQRPVGPFAHDGVDGSGGAWGERDQGRLLALADDPQDTMAVRDREICQVGAAGRRDPQRVERQRTGQDLVVAAGQSRLDKEGAEFGAVKREPGGVLGDLGSAYVNSRRVFDELFLDAVAVEAGDHDQLERDGGRREPAGLELRAYSST